MNAASSVLGFEWRPLAKGVATALVMVLLAWMLVPHRVPSDERQAFGPQTQNELTIEQYMFEHHRKPTVIVGSSVVTLLPVPHCRPRDVAGLYLQGRGARTGLEALLRIGARPRTVFIEVPSLFHILDEPLLEAVFAPLWRLRVLIPPLRHNRNWGVLLYHRLFYEAGGDTYVYSLPTVPVADWNEAHTAKFAGYMLESRQDEYVRGILVDVVPRVRELQRRGARVILFDSADPRIRARSPEKELRASLKAELPDVEFIDAPDDEMRIYRTDGRHFLDASGVQYFEWLMNYTKIPFTPRCSVVPSDSIRADGTSPKE
jgi:hypothetical protein